MKKGNNGILAFVFASIALMALCYPSGAAASNGGKFAALRCSSPTGSFRL